VKNRSLALLVAATALFSILGCRPLCRIEIPAPQATWTAWFGPEAGIERTGLWPTKWRRTVDYRGGTVFLEPVDGAVIAGCQPCEPFHARITHDFGQALAIALGSQCHTLKLAGSQDAADYLMLVKVVAVKEERLFFKLPIGLAGGARDSFEFWLKLVDARSQKVAFAYRSRGWPIESEEDLQVLSRWVASTLDQFKKDHN
jgi:hypothetical protein